MIKLFAKYEFLRNVATLFSGTVTAQLIIVASSPLLSRLYIPADFGVFASFIAVTTMVGVIASGRFEFAIVQAKTEDEANSLLSLSIMVSAFVSTLLMVVIILSIEWFRSVDILSIYWLMVAPFSVLLIGIFQSLNYRFNREKRFKLIAYAKIAQSIGNVGFAVLLYGLVDTQAFGLIIGHIAGQVLVVTFLIYFAYRNKVAKIKLRIPILKLGREYYKFPAVSVPGAMLNTAAIQYPVIHINKIFDIASAGYFNFIYRYIGGPLGLLSAAVGQVFLQKISTTDDENLFRNIVIYISVATATTLPFIFLLHYFGELIFAFVFGSSWSEAGIVASILIYSIAIRFIVSPLSLVLVLDKFLIWGFFWQLATFCTLMVYLIFFRIEDFYVFLIGYVVQDVISYIAYLTIILYSIKIHTRRERPGLRKNKT